MNIGKWTLEKKDLIWFIICLIIIIVFIIGFLSKDSAKAFDIISGASTVVSIILSAVAIIYTIIEGSNSSSTNADTQSKISTIDFKINDLISKIEDQKELERKLKYIIIPQVNSAVNKYQDETDYELSDELKKEIEKLNVYLNEDIED